MIDDKKSLFHHMKQTGICKQSVRYYGVNVRMKLFRAFSKSMYCHNNTGNPIFQSNRFSQKGQQAFVSALTQTC